jgi:hypothetical protein
MSHTSATFNNLRVNSAEKFIEQLSGISPNTTLYLTIGKTDAWANDASPPDANSSYAEGYNLWDNMIGGKRIVYSDLSHAVPRHDWTANTIYTQYDHTNPNLFDHDNVIFFVVNSDYSVYKCIGNNNDAPSTVEPTTFNTEFPIETADGYIWKYMYTISDSAILRYTTDEFIPVKTLLTDDGSLQWTVQNEAISGGLHHIKVLDGGENYSNVSNIVVSITGDGTSAVATANVSNGVVDKITITNPGVNYTFAEVAISGGGGSGAVCKSIISPPGGHGSNPVYELGARFVMVDVRLKYSEEGFLPTTNDYRQIAIIKSPKLRSTSNVATVSAFSQMLVLTSSGDGEFEEDEIVYQGPSLALSTFQGRVVRYDTDTNKVYLINTKGTPTASRSLIGAESFTTRILASAEQPQMIKNTGSVFFCENLQPVQRSVDQIENYKTIIIL